MCEETDCRNLRIIKVRGEGLRVEGVHENVYRPSLASTVSEQGVVATTEDP